MLFSEVGNKLFVVVGASCLEQGIKSMQETAPSHCPKINEGDRDVALEIPPSLMRWGRSAVTLVLKSYCITLCGGCDPL